MNVDILNIIIFENIGHLPDSAENMSDRLLLFLSK